MLKLAEGHVEIWRDDQNFYIRSGSRHYISTIPLALLPDFAQAMILLARNAPPSGQREPHQYIDPKTHLPMGPADNAQAFARDLFLKQQQS